MSRAHTRLGSILCLVLLPGLALAGGDLPEEPEAPDTPLVPIPSLLRPAAKARKKGPAPQACESASLTQLPDRLPFGPGEQLEYDVSLLGMRTGKVTLSMGRRERVDGMLVYPVKAHGRTQGMANMLGTVDVKALSYLDPGQMKPVRMANRSYVDAPFKDTVVVRDDAAFSGSGQATSHIKWWVDQKKRQRKAKHDAPSDLVDVLGLVYYARSRVFDEDSSFCFEVYHRSALWRIEGKVGGVELIDAPFGTQQARKVDAAIRRLTRKGPAKKARTAEIWVSEDDRRLPLIIRSRDAVAPMEGALVQWKAGRRLQRRVASR